MLKKHLTKLDHRWSKISVSYRGGKENVGAETVNVRQLLKTVIYPSFMQRLSKNVKERLFYFNGLDKIFKVKLVNKGINKTASIQIL